MPTLLQINVTANWGSTGKIAEDIGKVAMANGWESYIAYGRDTKPSSTSKLIPIGNKWDMYYHGIQTRIFDKHGLASKKATKELIKTIKLINPDIIHLHNIHGYFINYEILFEYLSISGKPIVWTLHDCWPFTGHCAHFDFVQCNKWKEDCANCRYKKTFPTSNVLSNSADNYKRKKKSFTSIKDLTLIPVSNWLHDLLEESFLNKYPRKTIHNGIDTNVFTPTPENHMNNNKFSIIGVASVWTERKGLKDFIRLRKLLPQEYCITMIGLNKEQIESLPPDIKGIVRTNSLAELIEYYSTADVYVNPTYEDNFPTTNIEALACGTPVITYDTGGSTEAINQQTGYIVKQGDIEGLSKCITMLCNDNYKEATRKACRERAVALYNKDDRFDEYLNLYNSLLKKQNL